MPATTILGKSGKNKIKFGVAADNSISIALTYLGGDSAVYAAAGSELTLADWFNKQSVVDALTVAMPGFISERLRELNQKLATAERNVLAYKLELSEADEQASERDAKIAGLENERANLNAKVAGLEDDKRLLGRKLEVTEQNANDWKDRADRFESMLSKLDQLATDKGLVHADEVHDVIRPKPAFQLPTKPGSGVRAKRPDIDVPDFREFRLFGNGKWHSEGHSVLTPHEFLTDWQDHQIIEEA